MRLFMVRGDDTGEGPRLKLQRLPALRPLPLLSQRLQLLLVLLLRLCRPRSRKWAWHVTYHLAQSS